MCNQSFILSEFTNDKIFNAVCKAQGRAKLMVEELGMSDLFRKHSMWGSDIRIMGIDGGAENESALTQMIMTSTMIVMKKMMIMRQILDQQNHKTLNHLLCRKHALMMQHKLLMI